VSPATPQRGNACHARTPTGRAQTRHKSRARVYAARRDKLVKCPI
jgi:hypothetical protein